MTELFQALFLFGLGVALLFSMCGAFAALVPTVRILPMRWLTRVFVLLWFFAATLFIVWWTAQPNTAPPAKRASMAAEIFPNHIGLPAG